MTRDIIKLFYLVSIVCLSAILEYFAIKEYKKKPNTAAKIKLSLITLWLLALSVIYVFQNFL